MDFIFFGLRSTDSVEFGWRKTVLPEEEESNFNALTVKNNLLFLLSFEQILLVKKVMDPVKH